jgi:hypothetical protein
MTDSQKIDVLARFVFHQYAMLSARVAALQQVVLKYGVRRKNSPVPSLIASRSFSAWFRTKRRRCSQKPCGSNLQSRQINCTEIGREIIHMAKQRLFPEADKTADDEREPHERFSDLATKIFTVPKTKIDEREKQWKDDKQRRRSRLS